jgi:hypothetical protein
VTAFHIVTGTGRMGTSYIASFLNKFPGVLGLHEGHLGVDEGADVLPMINVQQLAAYRSAENAKEVVENLRSMSVIEEAGTQFGGSTIIDVAYYNVMLASSLMKSHPEMRMVAIVRDCESFVRSATWLSGTDPMPVGWPSPEKPLDARERFIAMGRIRPLDGPAAEQWPAWSGIARNIWLWEETNKRLLTSVEQWRSRTILLNFSEFTANTDSVMKKIALWLLPEITQEMLSMGLWPSASDGAAVRQNSRVGGYQIGPMENWSNEEKKLCSNAIATISQKVEAAGGYD